MATSFFAGEPHAKTSRLKAKNAKNSESVPSPRPLDAHWNSVTAARAATDYTLQSSLKTSLTTHSHSDVAAWLANPADNQGWVFISLMNDMTPNSWGFVTSMNDKPAEHPKLVVVAANCP